MLKDAILKVKVLDERVRRSTVKLENDLTVSIPNCLLHFKKKAVIPEYMGKWLESAKREGYNIRGAIEQAPKGRIEDWLELENVDIFAKAWVNGYEIEQEKRYLVKAKGVYLNSCLIFEKISKKWFFSSIYEPDHQIGHHTKEELEQAGFGWVFDCEGMEVKEVEEEK